MRRVGRLSSLMMVAASLAAAGLPGAASAQTEISTRAGDIELGGRVQAQYSNSSVDAADADFFFRRVRLHADVTINDFVGGVVQPEFAGGAAHLEDAYVRLSFSDAVQLQLGQFKRSFDLFDLSSSTELSLIERDGRIEGVSTCAGVGGICSYARLVEALEFSGRDQGLRVVGASETLEYQASLTNGTGSNTSDENDAKSFSGRVTYAANDVVRVSGRLAVHDYVDPLGENASALAYGAEVELGTWRDRLHAQAAVVAGDNWRVLDADAVPRTFLALQGWVSYYYPLDGERLVGVEPVARVSFGDPDTDGADNGGTLVTPGVMFYFGGRNRIGANLDIYSPQGGDSEYSLKVQTYLYF